MQVKDVPGVSKILLKLYKKRGQKDPIMKGKLKSLQKCLFFFEALIYGRL